MKNLKHLGPGLVYAGAAIGVSHLVQSTRAGAQFGFYLIWAIILANVIKYPFFQMATRYTAATGDSLLKGYEKLGRWAVVLFLIMTLLTMFAIQSAVTIVTAGLAQQLFNLNFGAPFWSLILIVVSMFILALGKYSTLDKIIKVVIIILSLTTIISLIGALFAKKEVVESVSFNWSQRGHIFFLVALVGWMPAPIDVSIWSSLWSVEKNQELGKRLTLKEALFDFNIGYVGTTLLGLCFLFLGALIMYGSGEYFSPNAVTFASQLVRLYTKSLGSWTYPIISIAAFTTMFSTTITCLDAFPRVLNETVEQLFDGKKSHDFMYWVWIIVVAIGTTIVIFFFLKNMKSMVDFATTVAFVTSPIFAILNYLAINNKEVKEEYRISKGLKRFSELGIFLLSSFALYFLYFRYFA
jgi:Mn2+/Fe2+ NRAMP family transporter